MGTVVVGYVNKPEGRAALARGIEESKLRGLRLVVVSSHRGGQEYDTQAAGKAQVELDEVRAELEGTGVDFELRQLVRGFEPAEDLIGLAAGLLGHGRNRKAQGDQGSTKQFYKLHKCLR